MPMNFPDMQSLKSTARVHKFREPREEEPEDYYRALLFEHVLPIDKIEAFEIKFKVGWDLWTAEQKSEMLETTMLMALLKGR